MKDLVQKFTRQLQEARDIASQSVVSEGKDIQNILITGLGGSGIGGTILNEVISSGCPVPIIINKDYFIPGFVGPNTLVIISSYSGNTEETVSAMEQAIAKKAQIACITSGGRIMEMARQHQCDLIQIPGGMPPRSCIGYSVVQLVKVLVAKGFAPQSLFAEIDSTIRLLDDNAPAIMEEAASIAEKLNGKIPVIYSLGTCEGVAVRFRQQINENSKMLCWHHTFPEMNHNELVGWTTRNEDLVVISLQTDFDYERTRKRYEVCKPLFQKYSAEVIDIHARGKTRFEQFFYLIHLTDWISCYIADLKGIDPVEVKVIDHLKGELAKMA